MRLHNDGKCKESVTDSYKLPITTRTVPYSSLLQLLLFNIVNLGVNSLECDAVGITSAVSKSNNLGDCVNIYLRKGKSSQKLLIDKDSFSGGIIQNIDLANNELDSFKTGAFKSLNFLFTLILKNNKFRSPPQDALTNAPNLAVLNMEDNNLMDVTFNGPSNLTSLLLRSNDITKIKVENYSNLKILDLNSNQLSDGNNIEIDRSAQLSYLILSKNKLTTIPQTLKASSIITLNLDNNNIVKANLPDMPQLKALSLTNNRMTQLESNFCGDLPLLHFLDLTNNSIDVIKAAAFSKCKNITYLILAHNHFFKVPIPIDIWTGLIELDLSYNKIGSLDELVEPIFELESDTILDLRGNPLKCSCRDIIVIIGSSYYMTGVIFSTKPCEKNMNYKDMPIYNMEKVGNCKCGSLAWGPSCRYLCQCKKEECKVDGCKIVNKLILIMTTIVLPIVAGLTFASIVVLLYYCLNKRHMKKKRNHQRGEGSMDSEDLADY